MKHEKQECGDKFSPLDAAKTSTQLQRVHFGAPKSLTSMLKSSVMTTNRSQRAVFLCMILLVRREPSSLATYIDISEVASEYSDWLRMICRPQSCGSIVASGEEIVTMGAARKWWTYNSLTSIRQQCLDKSKSFSMIYLPEFNIPYRVVVSFVTY